MKFSLRVTLSCTVAEAFDALHNPAVFREVSAPFLRFEPVAPPLFPNRFTSGQSYTVRVKALGLLSLGTQEINPTSSDEGEVRSFRDNGRGLTGSLAVVKRFQHTMSVKSADTRQTELVDTLDFDAGALTVPMGLGFLVFWWWRHRKMRRLSPRWTA